MRLPKQMIVSTVFRWVFDDVSAGVGGRWPVRRDHGLYLPQLEAFETWCETAWWVPTGHAARLVHAGIPLELAITPPGWLASLDRDLTGREVFACPAAAAASLAGTQLPSRAFVKPSNAKLDQLEGGWSDDVATTLRHAIERGMAPTTIVEVCPDRLSLTAEWRTFVIDGQVGTISPYRIGPDTWEPSFDSRTDIPTAAALEFAALSAKALYEQGRTPQAYVLDVGLTTAGSWLVIEANAAWSSGTYGCDLRWAADAAVRASLGPVDRRWRWQPDATEAVDAEADPLR